MNRKSLYIAVALLACTVAFAVGSSVTASWTLATTNTDGSALRAPVKETLIQFYRPATNPQLVLSRSVAAPQIRANEAGLCGNYQVTFTTVLTNGETSDPTPPIAYASGVACATTKPNPPGNVSIT